MIPPLRKNGDLKLFSKSHIMEENRCCLTGVGIGSSTLFFQVLPEYSVRRQYKEESQLKEKNRRKRIKERC